MVGVVGVGSEGQPRRSNGFEKRHDVNNGAMDLSRGVCRYGLYGVSRYQA